MDQRRPDESPVEGVDAPINEFLVRKFSHLARIAAGECARDLTLVAHRFAGRMKCLNHEAPPFA